MSAFKNILWVVSRNLFKTVSVPLWAFSSSVVFFFIGSVFSFGALGGLCAILWAGLVLFSNRDTLRLSGVSSAYHNLKNVSSVDTIDDETKKSLTTVLSTKIDVGIIEYVLAVIVSWPFIWFLISLSVWLLAIGLVVAILAAVLFFVLD